MERSNSAAGGDTTGSMFGQADQDALGRAVVAPVERHADTGKHFGNCSFSRHSYGGADSVAFKGIYFDRFYLKATAQVLGTALDRI